jgi:hypothetical protein
MVSSHISSMQPGIAQVLRQRPLAGFSFYKKPHACGHLTHQAFMSSQRWAEILNEGEDKSTVIGELAALIVAGKLGTNFGIDFDVTDRQEILSFKSSSDTPCFPQTQYLSRQARTAWPEEMSKSFVAPALGEVLDTRTIETPHRDEAFVRSLSRSPNEIMMAARPRIFD